MRVIVLGQKGWIGGMVASLVRERHGEVFDCPSRPEQFEAFRADVRAIRPSHVILCIGRTHGTDLSGNTFSTIDVLEQNGMLSTNLRDNLVAVVNAAIVCRELGIHLTYFGTGCIYEYALPHHPLEGKGFREDDEPNFQKSSYSAVKSATDQILRAGFGDCVLNLRIRMPITGRDHPRNFITKIIGYPRICSVPNSMSVLPDLLPCALDLLEAGSTGTFNLTNPGVVSHNEILEMYREEVDPDHKWQNFTVDEQSELLAAPRSNNCLDTTRLQSTCQVPHIKDSVRSILRQWGLTNRKKGEEEIRGENG